MTEEVKEKIKQIIIASILLVLAVIIDKFTNLTYGLRFALFMIPYLASGFDVIKEAFEKVIHREFMEEEFLMTVATFGAMCIGFLPNSKAEFIEAVFVMLFYNVGELFEEIAEGTTEKSIKSLLDIRPDFANIEKDGKIVKADPKKLKIGDVIIVKPGEKVPIDGKVIDGTSTLNTVTITGESIPRKIEVGCDIFSGSVNLTGTLKVKLNNTFEKSTASKIIELVKDATEHKSKNEKFISKFSKVYTPLVVGVAVILAIVPPIISGDFLNAFNVWLLRALTFLVISCPCALVISVPLAFFGGIGGASKRGIIIKGSDIIEKINKIKTIVFDKTGTITEGVFEVTALHSEIADEKQLLHMAADVERYSNHPIAKSLKKAYSNEKNDECKITEHQEIAGKGIKAKVNEKYVYVGNEKLMQSIGIDIKSHKTDHGTIIHVAMDGKYLGHIIISDRVKDKSKQGIKILKKKNIETIMISGDKKDIAKEVAEEVGINNFYGELLPEEKLNKLVEIIEKQTDKNEYVAFVGDGINDSPSIARADVGISMGSLGSDVAIEASDVILMDDDLSKINVAIEISKKTLKISKENIAFSLIVKFAFLILAAFGLAPMYMAVFADVGVTIIATLNSMRTLQTKNIVT